MPRKTTDPAADGQVTTDTTSLLEAWDSDGANGVAPEPEPAAPVKKTRARKTTAAVTADPEMPEIAGSQATAEETGVEPDVAPARLPEVAPSVYPVPARLTDRPPSAEALLLAMEDYLLRHRGGWLVVSGPLLTPKLRGLPKGPASSPLVMS